MKSTDVVGYTIEGAVYCPDCISPEAKANKDDCSPVFADQEWDYTPTCDTCGEKLEGYNLTREGMLYECDSHDVEIFEVTADDLKGQPDHFANGDDYGPGWYAWVALPGCLPDSDPIGPFDNQEDAIDEAYQIFVEE